MPVKTFQIARDDTSVPTYLTQFAEGADTYVRNLVANTESNITVPQGSNKVIFETEIGKDVWVSNAPFVNNEFPADGSGQSFKINPPGIELTTNEITLYFLCNQPAVVIAGFFK